MANNELKKIEEEVLKAQEKTAEISKEVASLVPPIGVGANFIIPELTGDTPDVSNAKAANESLKEHLRIQAEEDAATAERLKTEKEAEEKRIAEERKWYEKLPIAGKFLAGEAPPPSVTAERAEQFEELGVRPTEFFAEQAAATAEIGSLLEDYDKMVAFKDRGLLNIETRLQGRPGAIVRGEQALFEKQENIKLSQSAAQIKTKMAIQEMKNGNFEQARNFVREAVSDWTFDLKLELQQFEQFEEQNAAIIADLDEEYKTALSDAKAAKLAELELVDKEKTDVLNLRLDNLTAGIEITDTLEEAVAKVEAAGPAPELLSVAEAKSLGVPFGTTREQAFGITPTGVKGKTAVQIGDTQVIIPETPTTSNVQELRTAGADRASARAILDNNTELTTSSVDDLLDRVYGKESLTKQDIISSIGTIDIDKKPRSIAENEIRTLGFNPETTDIAAVLDARYATPTGLIRGAVGGFFKGVGKFFKGL